MSSKERLIGLDIFRIISTLIVLFFHSIIHLKCNYGILQDFLGMGAVMMTGFFMLSGYVMFQNYGNRDLSDWSQVKAFYKKRAFGILPAYYVIGLMYVLILGKESMTDNILLAPVELLGIQTMFTSLFSVSHNGGTWFISCLLFCYILFPFGALSVKHMQTKEKIILLIFAIFTLLYSPFIVRAFETANIYSNPFFRFMEFLVGIILSALHEKLKAQKAIKKYFLTIPAIIVETIIMIIGVTLAVKCNLFANDYMMYSWICLPMFLLMFPALANITHTHKETGMLNYLSSISYAFFLAQFFVWPIMRNVIEHTSIDNNIFKIVMCVVLCFGGAVIIHEIIEKPINFHERKP